MAKLVIDRLEPVDIEIEQGTSVCRIEVCDSLRKLAVTINYQTRGPNYQMRGAMSIKRSHITVKYQEKMVPGDGFEPPTRGFSIRCSTN